MNRTERTIIERLRSGPADSYALSDATGVQKESVRRSISHLRRAGWNISYGTASYYSQYTLHTPEQATA